VDRNTVIGTVLIALIMVVWLFWLSPPQPPPTDSLDADSLAVPTQPESPQAEAPQQQALPPVPSDSSFAAALQGEAKLITVETDLYTAQFSTRGATPVSFAMKEYAVANTGEPVQLVDTTKQGALGLFFTTLSNHNVDTRSFYFQPSISSDRLQAVNGPAELSFVANVGQGAIRLTYSFTPGSYEVGLRIEQPGASSFATQEGYELTWDGALPFSEGNHQDEVQRSGAFSRSGGEVESVLLMSDTYGEQRLSGDIDWVAVKNKYFTAAILPSGSTRGAELIGERVGEADLATVQLDYQARLMMPAPDAEADVFRFYLGPIEYYRLADYELGLYEMVDYGWDFFEWITRTLARFAFIPAFTYLSKVLPNYGLDIIVLAILVKLLVYPLTKKSYESMARMRELQPKMEAIKEKYGDNPQKQ
jgi:YidC/Oxa1 family membrane protein insertase